MGWFKQLCLSLIILSACVSCQELTSTLHEGNHTCPGDEVIFTCTISSSSGLSNFVLAWSSDEYIGQGGSLQFSTSNMLGTVETSTIDGSVTATLTNNTNVTGVRVLESTLHITAVEASTVTCSGTSGDTRSIEFSISAVPGVPQLINAAEISRPLDTIDICIILVTWDPPANTDASDIGQYVIYVPSRNIREVSSSTISTLTVSNCGDDIRVQVAAVNRDGCVGMNSSEVQLALLNIPTVSTEEPTVRTEDGSSTTEDGSATTGGGSAPAPRQLGAGAIAGIAIGTGAAVFCLCAVALCCMHIRRKRSDYEIRSNQSHELAIIPPNLKDAAQTYFINYNLQGLYHALLEFPSKHNMQDAARDLRKALEMESSSTSIKEALTSCLKKIQSENGQDVQRVFKNVDNIFTGMTGIDEKVQTCVRRLRTQAGEHQGILKELINKVNTDEVQPDVIIGILLKLCWKVGNLRQVKDYYCKQSKYDFDKLGTEEDRVSVPIWVDDKLDDTWKDNLREAVQAVNEAAPGLSLTLIEDENGAIIHVLAINKEEPYTAVEGNILMRSITETCDFVTKIHLGKWKDDEKKGVCIHELIHALGFHHEHHYAIEGSKYVYRLDSGKKITIDKSELGFIRWESSSTTLYPCEKKCRVHSEDHICIWVLEAYPTKVNADLDEHDMVGLNLVYPPCVDKAAYNVIYKPKLGRNGIYYCGRKILILRKYPNEVEYNKFCGPDKGPNCSACRTIKSPRVEEILAGGRWQGMTGRVYCGRPFAKPTELSEIHDGVCGMDDGPACPDCNNILNKEESANQ